MSLRLASSRAAGARPASDGGLRLRHQARCITARAAADDRCSSGALVPALAAGVLLAQSVSGGAALAAANPPAGAAATPAVVASATRGALAERLPSAPAVKGPLGSLGEVADLNADVRDLSSDYRDPAIATPQDKVADALSGGVDTPSLPDVGATQDRLSDAAESAKAKAKNILGGSSWAPGGARSLGEVADLNADVRDLSSDYRDPAGAVQQDNAAEAARKAAPAARGKAAEAYDKAASSAARTAKKAKATVAPSKPKPQQAERKRSGRRFIGNDALSRPVVKDSLGVTRPGSSNPYGSAS